MNYATLQTMIISWLHRNDLASVIPSFITLAESRINRRIKAKAMESAESVTLAQGSRYAALPSGFVSELSLLDANNDELKYLRPELLPVYSDSGAPVYWTVDGTNIAVERPADQSYALTFRMLKAFSLSDSAPTNWLLTNHPDVYLYGALLESAPFIRDDGRVALWQDRFDRALSEVNAKESRNLATLVTDISVRGTTSIFEG